MEPYLFLMIGGLVIGVASDVVKPKPRGWWRAAWIAAAIILFVAGLFLMPSQPQPDPPTPEQEQQIGTGKLVLAGAPMDWQSIVGGFLVLCLFVGLLYARYLEHKIKKTTGDKRGK